MPSSHQVQLHALRSMPEAITKLIMEVYRGDEHMFEYAQLWVERFLPEEAFKQKAQHLRTIQMRQADLMARLRNEDLVKYATSSALDPGARRIGRRLQWQLEDDMEIYANDTWGERFFDEQFERHTDVQECENTLEEGYLLWVELRTEMIIAFAELLHMILRKVETLYNDEALPSQLGHFTATQASRYEAEILKSDTNKLLEERTVLKYVVAYSLFPPSDDEQKVLEELKKIIRAGVRVSGLRFAASYEPKLGRLEEQAAEAWFKLHAPEQVQNRFEWIEQATKGSGLRKEPSFLIHAKYADKLPEGELCDTFPTPFLMVPERVWKRSLMQEEMFPPDLLSGRIRLEPVDPDTLFLRSEHKQSPFDIIVATRGSGKSTLTDSIGCWMIKHGYVVFRPTMPRIQDVLNCLPLTPDLKDDWRRLQQLRLKPEGMPCKFVTVYENEDDIRFDEPFTVHDVKVRVDSILEFRLNWKKLLENFDRGYLMFHELRDKTRTQGMRACLIRDFFNNRRVSRRQLISWQNDEVQNIYGAVFSSSEEATLVRTVQDQMNDVRGLGVPVVFSTRSPAMLQPDLMESVSSFIFSDVAESGADESRSGRQRLLKALRARMPDSEKRYLVTVERIMENIDLRKLHLFFRHDHNRSLSLIQATLPPHMLEDDQLETEAQIKNYEKETGMKVLVEWQEIPELKDLTMKSIRRQTRKPYGGSDLPEIQ